MRSLWMPMEHRKLMQYCFKCLNTVQLQRGVPWCSILQMASIYFIMFALNESHGRLDTVKQAGTLFWCLVTQSAGEHCGWASPSGSICHEISKLGSWKHHDTSWTYVSTKRTDYGCTHTTLTSFDLVLWVLPPVISDISNISDISDISVFLWITVWKPAAPMGVHSQ